MKSYNILLCRLFAGALLTTLVAGFVSCTDDEFVREAGVLPAKGAPAGKLYIAGTHEDASAEFIFDEDLTVEVVYRLDQPATQTTTVTVAIGNESVVNAYNDRYKYKDQRLAGQVFRCERYRVVPETNLALPQTMTLTVEAGKTESAPLKIGVKYNENLLENGTLGIHEQGGYATYRYLLPLSLSDASGSQSGEPLYCQLLPVQLMTQNADLPVDKGDFFMIGNVDLRKVNPLIANEYLFSADGGKNTHFLFDILNLLEATVDRSAGSPKLTLSNDLQYILDHRARYLAQIQEVGTKICMTVQSAGKGYGFCSLSDADRDALVWQIARVVKQYSLDGVNLYDKAPGYGAAGTPTDPASYTRLLDALRKVLPDKLITLVDTHAPESGLYEAHDGLQAGTLLDYAWPETPWEVICPWEAGSGFEPIAGLEPGKWCGFTMTYDYDKYFAYSMSFDPIFEGEPDPTDALRTHGCQHVHVVPVERHLQDQFEAMSGVMDIYNLCSMTLSNSIMEYMGGMEPRNTRRRADYYMRYSNDW